MASRYSTSLGGLPDIPQGIDIDSIVKIATLFNQMSEQRALYGSAGTPGKPGTEGRAAIPATPASGGELLTDAPRFNPIRRFFGGGAAPVRGIESVPTDLASAEPTALQNLMMGGTAYVRGGSPALPGSPAIPATPGTPGTPGTVGLKELAIKTDLATAGLLDPEALTRRGLQPGDVLKKPQKEQVYFNSYAVEILTPAEYASLPPEQQRNYQLRDADKAQDEVGKWIRQKVSASGDDRSELIRLYSELNKADFPSTTQRNIIKALERIELPRVLGLKDAIAVTEKFVQQREKKYKADKADAVGAIQAIHKSAMSGSEKRARINTILAELESTWKDEDFFDVYEREKNKLLKGR